MNKVISHLVLGSGVAALGVAHRLTEKGLPCTILTSERGDSPPLDFLDLKPAGTSFDPYFHSSSTPLQAKEFHSSLISYQYGGFTNVWGGTFEIDEGLEFKKLSGVFRPKTVGVDLEIDDRLHRLVDKDKASQTIYAKISSGYSNSLHSQNSDDFIPWSPVAEWQRLRKLNPLLEISRGFLCLRIERHGDTWKVFATNPAGTESVFLAKNLYLCLGVFGSAQILIKSGICKDIRIIESPIFFTAALAWGRQTKSKPLNYSQVWRDEIALNTKIRLQIYSSRSISDSDLETRLGKTLGKLVKRVSNFIFPIIGYLDYGNCPEFKMSLQLNGIPEIVLNCSASELAIYRLKRSVAVLMVSIKLILKRRLVFWPIPRWGRPGSSYHCVGLLNNCLLEALRSQNLIICDGLGLGRTNLGSITPSIFAKAYAGVPLE